MCVALSRILTRVFCLDLVHIQSYGINYNQCHKQQTNSLTDTGQIFTLAGSFALDSHRIDGGVILFVYGADNIQWDKFDVS